MGTFGVGPHIQFISLAASSLGFLIISLNSIHRLIFRERLKSNKEG